MFSRMKWLMAIMFIFYLANFGYSLSIENTKRISLRFQNVNIRYALQVLAELAKINIVIADGTTGNLSINLQNVTWQQALTSILSSKGLVTRQLDDVILVGTQTEIFNPNQQNSQSLQQPRQTKPLQSLILTINYSKASIIMDLLQQKPSQLASGAKIFADDRTNTLWIEDAPEKLLQIKKIIQKLDRPEKQVLIRARIVNLDKTYERDLGIRWNFGGLGKNSNAESGGNQQANMMNGFHLDLPANNVGQIGGAASMGLKIFKLEDNMLDLELSALESEGDAQIIASPQIITVDQKEAFIETGEEIPFQQATLSGATAVNFQKAVVSLRVTPQVTSDSHILLNLIVNQDKRGSAVVQGVPTIDTQEMQTQVLVNNNQTIVLGGIYQDNNNNNVEKIPFLGALPGIGHLFRHTLASKQQRELLIFVTPEILN